MDNLFAQASRRKLRFDSPKGLLSVEDLWDLPLRSTHAGKASLDNIAIALNKELKEAGTTSFVDDAPAGNEELRMGFEVVLHIIEVRKAENKTEELRRINAEKKQQILSIISAKENEALAGKSIDELRELVGTL